MLHGGFLYYFLILFLKGNFMKTLNDQQLISLYRKVLKVEEIDQEFVQLIIKELSSRKIGIQ
ncbi:sporulation histidine kinase inhibitor Sda [Paenibacillus silviterrae]|uniref:sporulation histidine kinase inhibitor Sda n=1 Tax=Paenibacillus silviterrae TaxID=3242194 RepID=UPI00350E347A